MAGVAVLALVIAAPLAHGQVKLQKDTEVSVTFKQDVSSKYLAPGDEIPIQLLEDIVIGGVVLVKAGAPGKAMVKSVEPAGKRGKPGKMSVELVELDADGNYKAMDDKKITLEAVDGTIEVEGKGKKTLSYILGFGFFIKGGEAVIPADTEVKAKVNEDVFVLPSEG
jgi:hypothetical protein